MIDNCYRDCLDKYFHTFENRRIYDIEFRYIGNNEVFNLKISDKSMDLNETKKIGIARQRGFFNQINKLIMKVYSHQ